MKSTRNIIAVLTLSALAITAFSAGGCSSKGSEVDGNTDDVVRNVAYEADLSKMSAALGGAPINKIEDAFTITILAGDKKIPAPTHLFGPVRVIPYADGDNLVDAAGKSVLRGDQAIAAEFAVGEVGYGIKHHRPSHRVLDLASSEAGDKENFKLQDTHIEIVIGVMRDGKPGAVTMNNPQTYQQGRFGDESYPMVFVKPTLPSYVPAAKLKAFNDNIRSMVVAFNAVSNFPGEYNGGDPLGARNPDRVREHAAMMVKAITGDAEARAFFEKPENLIYCAELAHISTSAGLILPLNKKTFVGGGLVSQQIWDSFVKVVEAHNKSVKDKNAPATAFTEMNKNPYARLIEIKLADEDLTPVSDYAGAAKETEAQKLAFEPMTMSDIIEQFMRTHIPREKLGEGLADLQGKLLKKMQPSLFESMGLDDASIEKVRAAGDAAALEKIQGARKMAETLFDNPATPELDSLVEVVGHKYENYEKFRAALAPLLAKAHAMTGPRGDSGKGLFVPPSLLHVTAQRKHNNGLVQLAYVGHGIHYSFVKIKPGAATRATPVRESCGGATNSCGGTAPLGTCGCDAVCVEAGDCCSDREAVCAAGSTN